VQQINRPIVFQPFETFNITVAITPTPLSATFTKADLIDSFAISLDAAAANNIFLGGTGVTVNNGLEIVRGGGPVLIRIINQHVQYDIHSVIDPLAEQNCNLISVSPIPYIIWDLTQICLVAAAPTNARIAPFRSMFV